MKSALSRADPPMIVVSLPAMVYQALEEADCGMAVTKPKSVAERLRSCNGLLCHDSASQVSRWMRDSVSGCVECTRRVELF